MLKKLIFLHLYEQKITLYETVVINFIMLGKLIRIISDNQILFSTFVVNNCWYEINLKRNLFSFEKVTVGIKIHSFSNCNEFCNFKGK